MASTDFNGEPIIILTKEDAQAIHEVVVMRLADLVAQDLWQSDEYQRFDKIQQKVSNFLCEC
jgi:hypothetical protein